MVPPIALQEIASQRSPPILKFWSYSMSHVRRLGMLGVFALLFTVGQLAAAAEDGKDGIKTVFVIAMENHNWTQPANQFSGPHRS
jgi:hypothetical protein